MRWSFRIARVLGIDVKLHLTFLLLPLLFGFSAYAGPDGGWWAALTAFGPLLLLFGCVLLHEFGHALAARHFGIQTVDITLLPIGGIARLERMPEEPAQELIVALAGPLVNVVIILGLGAVLGVDSLRWAFFSRLRDNTEELTLPLFLLAVNVKLLLFNLIPAFPMDGGRVLRALLTTRLGYARATRIAAAVGQVFAVLFALAGLGVLLPNVLGSNWVLVFIAYFLYTAGAREAGAAQMRSFTRDVPLAEATLTEFRTLPLGATLGDAMRLLVHTTQHDLPVMDSAGKVAGVLTRKDILDSLNAGGESAPVSGAMHRAAPSFTARKSPLGSPPQ